MSDRLLFFRQLLSKPKQISAISPSSPWLARAVAKGLGPDTGKVVEFGPGTGALTRGILAAGVAARDLTVFEMDADFVQHLAKSFPGITIHNTGAQLAPRFMARDIAAVISGLPLLSMPAELRMSIVGAAFQILQPGGRYVQFTYGARPALTLEQMNTLGITVDSGVKVWANLPPARVFTFRRRSEPPSV